eukprot:6163310-Pyramimonas_sp.AAC.1
MSRTATAMREHLNQVKQDTMNGGGDIGGAAKADLTSQLKELHAQLTALQGKVKDKLTTSISTTVDAVAWLAPSRGVDAPSRPPLDPL